MNPLVIQTTGSPQSIRPGLVVGLAMLGILASLASTNHARADFCRSAAAYPVTETIPQDLESFYIRRALTPEAPEPPPLARVERVLEDGSREAVDVSVVEAELGYRLIPSTPLAEGAEYVVIYPECAPSGSEESLIPAEVSFTVNSDEAREKLISAPLPVMGPFETLGRDETTYHETRIAAPVDAWHGMASAHLEFNGHRISAMRGEASYAEQHEEPSYGFGNHAQGPHRLWDVRLNCSDPIFAGSPAIEATLVLTHPTRPEGVFSEPLNLHFSCEGFEGHASSTMMHSDGGLTPEVSSSDGCSALPMGGASSLPTLPALLAGLFLYLRRRSA